MRTRIPYIHERSSKQCVTNAYISLMGLVGYVDKSAFTTRKIILPEARPELWEPSRSLKKITVGSERRSKRRRWTSLSSMGSLLREGLWKWSMFKSKVARADLKAKIVSTFCWFVALCAERTFFISERTLLLAFSVLSKALVAHRSIALRTKLSLVGSTGIEFTFCCQS